METIQIVLAKKLLLAVDRVARRTKRDRSAVIGGVLREHLKRSKVRIPEELDRVSNSYSADRSATWKSDGAWPQKQREEAAGFMNLRPHARRS